MAVDNFNKSDLVGRNLQRLVQEIEDLASDGTKESYDKLRTFYGELFKVTSDATLVVTKKDGKKVMTINDEEIDLTEVLKGVMDLTNDRINKNSATPEQQKAREALRKTMSETVGVLLKSDEIDRELASRDLTVEEYTKHAEAEIKKSEQAVADLRVLETERKAKLDKFGKTIYLESAKEYASKSAIDDLRLDKASIEKMKIIEDKLKEIQALKNAAKTMDPDSTDYENNKKAIEVLIGDVKGAAKDLKAMDLHKGEPKTEKIDFSYLDRLDVMSDFNEAKRKVNSTKTEMTAIIDKDYETVRGIIKANYAEFGFADEAAVDALSKDELDKVIETVEVELDKVQKDIKYEENYQQEIRDGIERYKEIYAREQELAKKIKKVIKKKPVMVPKKDAEGNPIIEDGKPVMEQKMMEVTDADGNITLQPVFEEVEVMEPTDEARREYLEAQGIDETDYRRQKEEEAIERAEQEEASLTTEEKREMIREDYKRDGKRFHPIQWLRSQFFPGMVWDRDYAGKYLTAAKDEEVRKAKAETDEYLASKIKESAEKDKLAKNEIDLSITLLRDAYKSTITSAVSQEKITDELYRGSSEDSVREGATRAAVTDTMQQVVTVADFASAVAKRAKGEISKEKFDAIHEKFNKDIKSFNNNTEARKVAQDRGHASDVLNTTKTRKPETPTYKDER